MEKHGFVSKVHRKKPHLKPMPRHIQESNAGKSVIRSRVEHVFADQKSQTGLFIRTVGITRATMRIGLANIVYNITPLPLHGADHRHGVAIQRMSNALRRTQIEGHHGNHQSKRQKPKIQKKAYQSTVLRSLQLCQTFAKQPNHFGIGYSIRQSKAKETHEG